MQPLSPSQAKLNIMTPVKAELMAKLLYWIPLDVKCVLNEVAT